LLRIETAATFQNEAVLAAHDRITRIKGMLDELLIGEKIAQLAPSDQECRHG
jgi:hypothetical protein